MHHQHTRTHARTFAHLPHPHTLTQSHIRFLSVSRRFCLSPCCHCQCLFCLCIFTLHYLLSSFFAYSLPPYFSPSLFPECFATVEQGRMPLLLQLIPRLGLHQEACSKSRGAITADHCLDCTNMPTQGANQLKEEDHQDHY